MPNKALERTHILGRCAARSSSFGSQWIALEPLTFAPGQTTQTISVPVIGDRLYEPDETFFINLSDINNATIADAFGVGTILDNDEVPSLVISDRSITEDDDSTTNAVFTVNLSTASTQTVTVNYGTANGTATDGSDYTAISSTLTSTTAEETLMAIPKTRATMH